MSAGALEGLVTGVSRAHSLRKRVRYRTSAGVAGLVGLSLLIGCGNSGGEEEGVSVEASVEGSTTATDTAMPACKDVRNMVVFSVFGAATDAAPDELARWMSDPDAQPVARPGAAEVATAYQELGYHLLYVALEPADTQIGNQPLVEAITVWLGVNGFPIGGYDTHVWAWDGEGEGSVALTEQLTRETSEGTEFAAGYVGEADLVIPFVTGGVPRESMFTVDAKDDGETSTSLPGDLNEHLPDVQSLDRVCE